MIKRNMIFTVSALFIIFMILQAFKSNGEKNTSEKLYQEYCASCHGVSGDGTGDLAYLVYPKPRDFTGGKFKIKSTLPGLPPTDDDLFKTIRQGMPGTAMPAFNFLKDDEIKSLTGVIKEFSSLNNQNVRKISIPTELPYTNEIIDLGKSI